VIMFVGPSTCGLAEDRTRVDETDVDGRAAAFPHSALRHAEEALRQVLLENGVRPQREPTACKLRKRGSI
jgi:hypothetical protein